MPTDECRCLMCADYGDRDRVDAADTELVGNVQEHGWGVIAIPADEISAGWAFTVGLWHTHRAPELAIFGMEPEEMMHYLNIVGEHAARGELVVGDVVDEVLDDDDRPVRLGAVDSSWERYLFGTFRGFYRATRGVPMLQALWPDLDGRFPGDKGFDEELDELQPRLWLPRDDHPPGPWTEED